MDVSFVWNHQLDTNWLPPVHKCKNHITCCQNRSKRCLFTVRFLKHLLTSLRMLSHRPILDIKQGIHLLLIQVSCRSKFITPHWLNKYTHHNYTVYFKDILSTVFDTIKTSKNLVIRRNGRSPNRIVIVEILLYEVS